MRCGGVERAVVEVRLGRLVEVMGAVGVNHGGVVMG